MLLVEVVLLHRGYEAAEWDSLYSDLPNRLVKVIVGDRNAFRTEDAERRLVSPPGLQEQIDDLVRRHEGGRSFVRPSGTEDVVRVYAEASTRGQADGESIGSIQTVDQKLTFNLQSLLSVWLASFLTRQVGILLNDPKSSCKNVKNVKMPMDNVEYNVSQLS